MVYEKSFLAELNNAVGLDQNDVLCLYKRSRICGFIHYPPEYRCFLFGDIEKTCVKTSRSDPMGFMAEYIFQIDVRELVMNKPQSIDAFRKWYTGRRYVLQIPFACLDFCRSNISVRKQPFIIIKDDFGQKSCNVYFTPELYRKSQLKLIGDNLFRPQSMSIYGQGILTRPSSGSGIVLTRIDDLPYYMIPRY